MRYFNEVVGVNDHMHSIMNLEEKLQVYSGNSVGSQVSLMRLSM